MNGNSGLSLVETLVALAIMSVVAYAIATMVAGRREPVLTLFDASQFVQQAKRDAISDGDAVTLSVGAQSISRPGDGTSFEGGGVRFSVEKQAGGPSPNVVIFPDGAFSARILAEDPSGRRADLTPVLEIDDKR